MYPDPYSPHRVYLECESCGNRAMPDDRLGSCPECGGFVRNLSVPRE